MTKILRSYVALLFSFLLLGCSGGSEDSTPETSPSLERIHIVASPVSTRGSSSLILAKGNNQPFIATGHYGDGSVKDLTSETSWHSSDDRIATLSASGALTARDAGTTTVTASHDGIISNTIQITVTDAVLTAIQVTPPSVSVGKGQTQQLTATATYSDNTTANVTGSVAWLPADITTANVSTTGILTGRIAGSTEVTASLDGVTSNTVLVTVTDAVLTAIQVTPPSVSVGKGQTRQLTATATYSDNTTANVTGSVAWLPDDTATATVTTNGLLTGVEQGTTEVTASLDGVTSNAVQVTVTDAVLTAIEITPPSVSVGKGQTRQLTATATYSDNTTANVTGNVAWLSDDTATATVISGLLTGVEQGTAEVTASLDGVTSNTVLVTVTDAVLTAIDITPPSVSVGKGQTQQLTATATYSDNTTADVTGNVAWLSDDTAAATVISGLLTGVEQGTAEVTASLDGVTSNTVQVTVTDAVLTAIQVTPPSVSVGKGQTQQLTATATYSDNTTADVTGSVAWLSDDAATATVISGLLTGVEEGTTEISANLDGVTSDRVTVNVVVTPLFGKFEGVFVNDFTFAVDAGFPTTGFDGAEFTLNTPSAPSDYTWSSDAPWVSVDSSGTVSFISRGNAAPVTITATPISGGEPLAYTFAITYWFHGSNIRETSMSDARSWCRTKLEPNNTWTVPVHTLLNRMAYARGEIGLLWSEWGPMRVYSDSTFADEWNYWALRSISSSVYYYVGLGHNGAVSQASSNDSNATVCHIKL
ncbi:Ig-like domain-containing protein [Aeromonas caviae]|uniref:Ig-like domain-containing protein n=1 Tax=Aeromonas caviae TaxID=648 RepID=UPI00191E3779|nr:Ig-like domain-containing protein [Aeromonas caviae]MBL0655172.1 Ig-like domain-containing protein [Aeromonas caviae]